MTVGVVRFITAFEETGSRTAHFVVAANGIGTGGIGFALRTVQKDPAAYVA